MADGNVSAHDIICWVRETVDVHDFNTSSNDGVSCCSSGGSIDRSSGEICSIGAKVLPFLCYGDDVAVSAQGSSVSFWSSR